MTHFLDKFWINLLISLFFILATFASFFIVFSPNLHFLLKNWTFFLPSGILSVIIFFFGVFKIIRFFVYFKNKKWLQTAFIFIQILLFFGLSYINFWLFLIKVSGVSTNPPY
jgi:hypothetical protein